MCPAAARSCAAWLVSAGDIQDGVHFVGVLPEFLDRLGSRQAEHSILRRLASRFTSFMTGNAPVPVPITRRSHPHGIFSSVDSGVCPKASRKLFVWLLVALADLAAMDHHVVLVRDAVDTDRTEGKRFDPHGWPVGYCSARPCAAADAKRPLGCFEGGCDRACGGFQ
jgi:hypothetical protein